MKQPPKFFYCAHCSSLVQTLNETGVTPNCCGAPMSELTPNTTEGATEKHLPVAKIYDGCVHVCVGSAEHPMTEEHSIQWIYLETSCCGRFHPLSSSEPPRAEFPLGKEKPVAVYAYCNLHGLWKTDLASGSSQ